MKIIATLTIKALILISLLFIVSCKKNPADSDTEYTNLEWIFLQEKVPTSYIWFAYLLYCNDIPNVADTFRQNDNNIVSDIKVKLIHYYRNDGYFEYKEIGSDSFKRVDSLEDYYIEYQEI